MRWPGRAPNPLRRLSGGDREAVVSLLDADPVNAVLARSNVDMFGSGPWPALGYFDGPNNELSAMAWDSGNLIPLGFSDEGLDRLAETVLKRGRICSSFVGPADQILGLWERVEPYWGPARDIRERQYSMVIDDQPLIPGDPEVRPARIGESDLVLPASVAMFTEEVGYDPTSFGSAYVHRAQSLIRSGRTYIKLGQAPDGSGLRVVFKADVGALAGGVAQIQGVWTAPDLRGRGIATVGMAAVVKQVLATFAPTVSLYVNDFNTSAVAAYRKVGFRTVGDWATVLF